MVGTAEGESFQGPDGLLQVATIWPGFLALNRPERLAAEAGRGAGIHSDRAQEFIGLGQCVTHRKRQEQNPERGQGNWPSTTC